MTLKIWLYESITNFQSLTESVYFMSSLLFPAASSIESAMATADSMEEAAVYVVAAGPEARK